ncbi:ABC transporter permease DevC [Scytonema sp. NUACC21]
MKQKTRLAVAVAGIAFADILIFAQMGFEASLYESSMAPQKSLDADLVVLNPHFETMFTPKSFLRERLYQAQAIEGVQSVSPLYIASGQWKNPENLRTQTILVFGTDPSTKAFKFPEVNQNRHQLQMLNTVLFDQASLPDFGPIATLFKEHATVETELNNINVRVSGLFTLGASFAAYGNLITSDSTFLHVFSNRNPNDIEVGLIKLKSGANTELVAKNLRAALPEDVTVLTLEGFAEVEKNYWARVSPIGFIFGLGVMVSFIVGIVIVYQIIYSDVADHLPEYATLKAMGYTDNYLLGIIVQEALILAVLGYMPAFVFAIGLYQLTATATMLPIFMTVERGVTVFILTLTMCFISGAIAMRKLHSADPADVF